MELVWYRDGGGKGWVTLVASTECRLMACEIGGFDDGGVGGGSSVKTDDGDDP